MIRCIFLGVVSFSTDCVRENPSLEDVQDETYTTLDISEFLVKDNYAESGYSSQNSLSCNYDKSALPESNWSTQESDLNFDNLFQNDGLNLNEPLL